jgi:hypothetical protein
MSGARRQARHYALKRTARLGAAPAPCQLGDELTEGADVGAWSSLPYRQAVVVSLTATDTAAKAMALRHDRRSARPQLLGELCEGDQVGIITPHPLARHDRIA